VKITCGKCNSTFTSPGAAKAFAEHGCKGKTGAELFAEHVKRGQAEQEARA
jgi:hypothetical protein